MIIVKRITRFTGNVELRIFNQFQREYWSKSFFAFSKFSMDKLLEAICLVENTVTLTKQNLPFVLYKWKLLECLRKLFIFVSIQLWLISRQFSTWITRSTVPVGREKSSSLNENPGYTISKYVNIILDPFLRVFLCLQTFVGCQ